MNTLEPLLNRAVLGDCQVILRAMPDTCIDLVVTDPPYLVSYQDRDGRRIANDNQSHWMFPAFSEIFRTLKEDRYCVCFYSWTHVDRFLLVWRECGFTPVGHFVFTKRYASTAGFTQAHHEQAYLLAKGRPERPAKPLVDVIHFPYSGNKLHPTQKPVEALIPLIRHYSEEGEVVLDPFGGSGSTGDAARRCRRQFVLIERDLGYHMKATRRLGNS